MRHPLGMGTPRDFDRRPSELSALEQLAARTAERAVRVRQHEGQARDEASRDRARGDDGAERLHLAEAETHERSARVIERTAALYRRHILRLVDAGRE